MRPITKNEKIGVFVVFLLLIFVTVLNLQVSIRKARDTQRRNDLGAISDSLGRYQQEFGFFPPSEDGKIKACKEDGFEEKISALEEKPDFSMSMITQAMRPCNWGIDSLRDFEISFLQRRIHTKPHNTFQPSPLLASVILILLERNNRSLPYPVLISPY